MNIQAIEKQEHVKWHSWDTSSRIYNGGHYRIKQPSFFNNREVTEAEDFKKRWQEYTDELYKKELHNPDSRDGVFTHLEPDILECEVKWTLESITMNKASGGYGIPV